MRSLHLLAFRALILTLVLAEAAPALAQVGAPPTAPTTLWNFLGIPYGIRKLQGATRNRRGNTPNLEPKPPMRAIADPRNLESPDKSIKKAAEVKQAEDLKKQKIKAVKYLTSVGCGCYDVDGGVTAALVASMGDCTEDVRYETIKAIGDAAEGECCSKCGTVCCCNQDILKELAKIAYERDDHGCYLEPSERVREAAAETMRICCPSDTSPMIVADEKPADVERETGPETEEDTPRKGEPITPPPPTPPGTEPLDPENLPSKDDATARLEEALGQLAPGQPEVSDLAATLDGSAFGVVVHVSPTHGLAHVHFTNPEIQPEVGSVIAVYQLVEDRRMLLGEFRVVESFAGSANVAGTPDDLTQIARGDLAQCLSIESTLPQVETAAVDAVEGQFAATAEDFTQAPADELAPYAAMEQAMPQVDAVEVQDVETSFAAPVEDLTSAAGGEAEQYMAVESSQPNSQYAPAPVQGFVAPVASPADEPLTVAPPVMVDHRVAKAAQAQAMARPVSGGHIATGADAPNQSNAHQARVPANSRPAAATVAQPPVIQRPAVRAPLRAVFMQ